MLLVNLAASYDTLYAYSSLIACVTDSGIDAFSRSHGSQSSYGVSVQCACKNSNDLCTLKSASFKQRSRLIYKMAQFCSLVNHFSQFVASQPPFRCKLNMVSVIYHSRFMFMYVTAINNYIAKFVHLQNSYIQLSVSIL